MTTLTTRRVVDFYNENKSKYEGTGIPWTKRQASKYLNHYGMLWKNEHNIPLSDPKRGK